MSEKEFLEVVIYIYIYLYWINNNSPISVVIRNRLVPYYLFYNNIILHFQFLVTWQIILKYFTHIIRLSPSHRPMKNRLIILTNSEVYLLESYLHCLPTL